MNKYPWPEELRLDQTDLDIEPRVSVKGKGAPPNKKRGTRKQRKERK